MLLPLLLNLDMYRFIPPFAPADDDYTFTEASVAATNESAGTEYV